MTTRLKFVKGLRNVCELAGRLIVVSPCQRSGLETSKPFFAFLHPLRTFRIRRERGSPHFFAIGLGAVMKRSEIHSREQLIKVTELGARQYDVDKSPRRKEARVQEINPTAPTKTGKRGDYLSWDEYFMAVAFLSAQRSKDPNSQVGACVVNPEKKIVGIGYNGMPNGCCDDELPWARTAENILDTKYPYGIYPFISTTNKYCICSTFCSPDNLLQCLYGEFAV